MAPESVRLFFVAGLSLFAGGFAGAYVTRAIYGDEIAPVDPIHEREHTCPPCPDCPTCPPPPDCGQSGLVPTSTAPRAILAPEGDDPERERKPGLSATAVERAAVRVREEIVSCLLDAAKVDARGSLLLDFTVTATGGQGFISDGHVRERSGDVRSTPDIERCIIDASRRARFEWGPEDGEAHFRLPVRLGT